MTLREANWRPPTAAKCEVLSLIQLAVVLKRCFKTKKGKVASEAAKTRVLEELQRSLVSWSGSKRKAAQAPTVSLAQKTRRTVQKGTQPMIRL